ncbi:PKD-like family lipoprotein [Gabonibacter chumensis]|uniref:PKD-like family lipoprotein n=1 Tax=Gabonibacter chumensis TaxID=2972474 RepID=UPI0025731AB3|nr:PKD-like family lipoprotein [Gabonibacter chumensis]MCR9013095.1 PKD-like family lipoprotein [Gabonibacter chumensis]
MNYIKLCGLLFFLGFLSGCFKDEGNYTYTELNPPQWIQDFNKTPEYISGWAGKGETMVFHGSRMFTWGSDSAARAKEVRYEWKIAGVVIGDQLDMELPTDSVFQKLGLDAYTNSNAIWGTFTVIEKETGVSFPARLYVSIYSAFAPNDWFILSEDGNNTKFSAICRRIVTEQGKQKVVYVLKDNAYEEMNGGKLPGKPVQLSMETARDISPSGACVVITDQVAYEVNIQNMEKVGEIKDQFLDGTPPNFVVSDLREKAPQTSGQESACTFVATVDGRVFYRVKSPNYLGGQYLSEPYVIDDRGYKITKFGHSKYGGVIPCYDEKNRRVVMATTWRDGGSFQGDNPPIWRTRMVPAKTHYGAPVSGFPEGTEVLYLTEKNHISWGYGGPKLLFTVYYNDPTMENRTLVGDFSFSTQSETIFRTTFERWFYLPVRLDASSVFLVSANNRPSLSYNKKAMYRDFYTVGDKLYYLQRSTSYIESANQRKFMTFNATFPSKITALAYAFYQTDQIFVGCEDGSIYCYDINNIENPRLLFQKKLNGKISVVKQIGWHTSNHDWY